MLSKLKTSSFASDKSNTGIESNLICWNLFKSYGAMDQFSRKQLLKNNESLCK